MKTPRYEAEQTYAKLVEKQGLTWEYEPRRFNLGDTTYKPDFYIPEEDLYVEVIATKGALHFHDKQIKKLNKLYPNIRLVKILMDNKKLITFEIDDELHKQLKLKAIECNKSIRSILTDLIKKWIKKG